MEERRSQMHSFSSMSELIDFFSQALPKELVKKTVKEVKEKFVYRDYETKEDNRIQLLKKCEWKLTRLVKKNKGIE